MLPSAADAAHPATQTRYPEAMVGDILQPTHLLFVLVVALLVLGPKRLPEVGRALGNGLRDFRSAIGGAVDETRDAMQLGPISNVEPTPVVHEPRPEVPEHATPEPGPIAFGTGAGEGPAAAAPEPVVVGAEPAAAPGADAGDGIAGAGEPSGAGQGAGTSV
jgi:sec-independent protein translocase protein TatA